MSYVGVDDDANGRKSKGGTQVAGGFHQPDQEGEVDNATFQEQQTDKQLERSVLNPTAGFTDKYLEENTDIRGVRTAAHSISAVISAFA